MKSATFKASLQLCNVNRFNYKQCLMITVLVKTEAFQVTAILIQ